MGEIPSHSQAILHSASHYAAVYSILFLLVRLLLFIYFVIDVAVVDRTHNWRKKLRCARSTQLNAHTQFRHVEEEDEEKKTHKPLKELYDQYT